MIFPIVEKYDITEANHNQTVAFKLMRVLKDSYERSFSFYFVKARVTNDPDLETRRRGTKVVTRVLEFSIEILVQCISRLAGLVTIVLQSTVATRSPIESKLATGDLEIKLLIIIGNIQNYEFSTTIA